MSGMWEKTWNEDRFLLHQDNVLGILVFATDENLVVMQRCPDLYIDGTFRTAPKPYAQYVTIHGHYNKRVITLASCLLSGKSSAHYKQVLQVLKQNVRQLTGSHLRPMRVVCDFEIGIISAVETELPGARLCGCMFHFYQSLYREINDLELSRAYKQDVHVKSIVRKVMALAVIPLALVRNCFQQLCASRRFRRISRHHPNLNAFVAYVDNTYFNGRFQPSMWNSYSRTRRTRTNNYVEGIFNQT